MLRSGRYVFFLYDAELKKGLAKARQLRASQWWKRKRSFWICHYCGEKFSPKALTMDHVIPLSRGGRSEKFITWCHAARRVIRKNKGCCRQFL